MNSLMEKLKFKLSWALNKTPLGAKVFISKFKEEHTIVGRCYSSGKITLYARRISPEETIEVLNHEVLHSLLHKIFDWKTSEALDKIHKWKGTRIIFQGIEDER